MVPMCFRKKSVISILIVLLFIYSLFEVNKRYLEVSGRPLFRKSPLDIAILVVVAKGTDPKNYELSTKSVECYARAQGYHFILAMDSDYDCSKNQDLFFRRHCVAAKILPKYSALLFIDADIGVVNPKKRIEEYLDDNIDVTFYDRFWNYEVMAGSYLAKNTQYAVDLIRDFGDYEFKLPNSFHGTDNGAIHMFLAEKLFPEDNVEVSMCKTAYNHSKNWDDVFTYEACIRTIFGAHTDFGRVRIMKKGTGWARDCWETSGVWNPERDFMMHGWKMYLLGTPPSATIPPKPDAEKWYSPFAGNIHLEKCTRGNTTWSYNPQLIMDRKSVDDSLRQFETDVARSKFAQMSKIHELMTRTGDEGSKA